MSYKQYIFLHTFGWCHGWMGSSWAILFSLRGIRKFTFPEWVWYSISVKLCLIAIPFQAINVLGWVVSVSFQAAAILTIYPLLQIENKPSNIDEALYYTLHRLLWAIALCYIIFACIHGYGGPVNWFLSLKLWQPIVRLNYAIYLVQFGIMTIFNGSMRHVPYFLDLFVVRILNIVFLLHWILFFEIYVIKNRTSSITFYTLHLIFLVYKISSYIFGLKHSWTLMTSFTNLPNIYQK